LVAVIIAVVIFLLLALLTVGGIGVFLLVTLNKDTEITRDYSNVSQYYGDYYGSSFVSETSGAEELADYLSDCGIEADIDQLLTDGSSTSDFAISLYDDASTSPSAFDMEFFMGDFFEYQKLNNRTFITYEDFGKGNYETGDLYIDEENRFSLSVEDVDQYGNYSEKLFGVKDTTGTYKIEMNGYIEDNKISGVLDISFIYGNMEVPYNEKINFSAVLSE